MKQPNQNWAWLWVLAAGLLLLSVAQPSGCNLVGFGSPPPFAADKPSVMISADLSIDGNQALGRTHPGVISAVTGWAKASGGQYWLDDTNQKNPPTNEAQWVQDAWKVADRAHPPSITGASKSHGIRPQPLPAKAAEVSALLEGLK